MERMWRTRDVDGVTVYSLFSYKNLAVSKVIRALKYEHVVAAARLCGEWLGDFIGQNFDAHAIIIPVPAHKKRIAERGFNQVELIVAQSGLAGATFDLLERTAYTKTQALLHEQERIENIKNSFCARRRCDPSRLYIIVDDVVTTGSTIEDCIRALRAAGAVHIVGVTIATTRDLEMG